MVRTFSPVRGVLPLLVLSLAVFGGCTQKKQQQKGPVTLPAHFDGGMIYVAPVTTTGDTLLFYTDTGGGGEFYFSSAVERYKLTPVKADEYTEEGGPFYDLPPFQPGASIPGPVETGHLRVLPENQRPPFLGKDFAGFLGQGWFQNRVWTFDYLNRKLIYWPSDNPPAPDSAHTLPLGFLTDSTGTRQVNFARMQAVIDGDTLNMLFDTGANVPLTDSAHAALADTLPQHRSASFIEQRIFDMWHKKHPGWRVIENAEATTGMPMIEVPEVTVAGQTVGPVWFTVRPDRNFDVFMSRWMDKAVVGALGGSAFQYFKITLDYPNSWAEFEK